MNAKEDESGDLGTFGDDKKPCGRKADWVVINDVLNGGGDFVVTCRECYKKGLGRFAKSHDELVPAWIFKNDVGRELLCDDEDGGLYDAFVEATKDVDDVPFTRREFARWLKYRDLEARFHRIAIHRRFERLESSVGMLTTIASISVALYAANRSKPWIPWGEWSWGAVFVIVWGLLDRLLRLGRFTSRTKIPPAPKGLS
jgi:hypothetical protein